MMTNQPAVESAVEFVGGRRIHVGLGVSSVERAIPFYETLLGSPPIKRRHDYAKFEPAEPSVNLSLYQAPATEQHRRLSDHYGVQVKSTEDVRAAAERFRAAGFEVREESQTDCCYAVQDKIWAVDPDGHRWEVFVVTKADVSCGTLQGNLSKPEATQVPDCCAEPATCECC